MNPATIAREYASHCEGKLHAFRKTQDGVVVSFVLHPQEVPEALQLAPLGSRYVIAFVEVGTNEAPINRKEEATSRLPKSAPEPTPHSVNAPVRAFSYAKRAGILCNDPRFWAFLREERKIICNTAEHAAFYVRDLCGVDSRSDILPGTEAEQRWNLIDSAFQAWKLAPEAGAA